MKHFNLQIIILALVQPALNHLTNLPKIVLCSKIKILIVVYLTSLCVNWTFFGTRGPF
jgi:hypothetical protein